MKNFLVGASILLIVIALYLLFGVYEKENLGSKKQVFEPVTYQASQPEGNRKIRQLTSNEKLEDSTKKRILIGQCEKVDSLQQTQHIDDDIHHQIKKIFDSKFNANFNLRILKWYGEQIFFDDFSPELKKAINSNRDKSEQKIKKKYGTTFEEIKESIISDDDSTIISLWERYQKIADSRSEQKLFSQYMFENLLKDGKVGIHNRLQLLVDIGAPIDPSIIYLYPADSQDELKDLVSRYQIILEPSESIYGERAGILEYSIFLNNKFAIQYLLNETLSKEELDRGLNATLYFFERSNMSLIESLWQQGARPTHDLSLLLNDLELKYPANNIIDKMRDYNQNYDNVFPFDNNLIWQFEQLKQEIKPLLTVNNEKKHKLRKECLEASSVWTWEQQQSVKQQALNLFAQGMALESIMQAFSRQSRMHVEIFRELFKTQFLATCHGSKLETTSKFFEKLIVGEIKLYQCVRDYSYFSRIMKEPVQYLDGNSLEYLLSIISPEDWNKFKISEPVIKLVLKNIQLFAQNGWDLNFIDNKNKTFFYYAVKYNNYSATKLLVELPAIVDADLFGWDALDYLILHSSEYSEIDQWIELFKQANWPIRDSHLEYLKLLESKDKELANKILSQLK